MFECWFMLHCESLSLNVGAAENESGLIIPLGSFCKGGRGDGVSPLGMHLIHFSAPKKKKKTDEKNVKHFCRRKIVLDYLKK